LLKCKEATEIQIYRNGKREVYEVGSDFARAFKNVDKTVWNDVAAFIGFPSKLLRAGATTFNPEFMYNNLPRDAFSSAILSKTWHPPFYAQLQGAALLINPIRTKLGYQPMFEKWVKSGGMKSTFASFERNYFQAGYKEIFTGIKFRNIITKPVEMIRVAAEASEYLGRMGNFKLSYLKYIKEGYPEKIAVRKAGYDATINPVAYARAGETASQPFSGGSGNTPSTSPSQGNNGGANILSANFGGGGGGGASAVGATGTGTQSGAGGNGTASSITGSSVTYAGGGGCGKSGSGAPAGAGGSGGGGTGATTGTGTAGTTNLGGGGGGASGNPATGGAGGKGVVILSLPTASYSGTTTGSPTVTTKNAGADTVLQFNGSGSYTT